MDKIRKLEQRWYRYRIKKITSSMVIFLLFPLVMVGGYFIGLNFERLEEILFPKSLTAPVEPLLSSKKIEQNVTIPEVLPLIAPIKVSLPPVVKEEKSENLLLEPVIPIINMSEEIKHTKVRARSRSTHKKQAPSHQVRAKPNSYITAQELSQVRGSQNRDTTQLKKIHLHSSSKDYIKRMKEKFEKHKNSRDALLLAKEFYRQHAYKEAENWALKANKIDSNSEESWIIFANAKAKMNRRDEAIKLLGTYYNKTKSAKIKRAIEKIKHGKI
jgi:hypothetical protein